MAGGGERRERWGGGRETQSVCCVSCGGALVPGWHGNIGSVGRLSESAHWMFTYSSVCFATSQGFT